MKQYELDYETNLNFWSRLEEHINRDPPNNTNKFSQPDRVRQKAGSFHYAGSG